MGSPQGSLPIQQQSETSGKGFFHALRWRERFVLQAWVRGKAGGGGEAPLPPPAPSERWVAGSLKPHMAEEGRARHPPARHPDKAEGALPAEDGRWGCGRAAGRPAVAAARPAPPEGQRWERGHGEAPREAPAWPPGPPAAPPSPAACCSPIPPRPPGVPSHPTEILPQPLPPPPAAARAGCPRRGRGGLADCGGGPRLEKGREGSSRWRTGTRCLLDDAPLQ